MSTSGMRRGAASDSGDEARPPQEVQFQAAVQSSRRTLCTTSLHEAPSHRSGSAPMSHRGSTEQYCASAPELRRFERSDSMTTAQFAARGAYVTSSVPLMRPPSARGQGQTNAGMLIEPRNSSWTHSTFYQALQSMGHGYDRSLGHRASSQPDGRLLSHRAPNAPLSSYQDFQRQMGYAHVMPVEQVSSTPAVMRQASPKQERPSSSAAARTSLPSRRGRTFSTELSA